MSVFRTGCVERVLKVLPHAHMATAVAYCGWALRFMATVSLEGDSRMYLITPGPYNRCLLAYWVWRPWVWARYTDGMSFPTVKQARPVPALVADALARLSADGLSGLNEFPGLVACVEGAVRALAPDLARADFQAHGYARARIKGLSFWRCWIEIARSPSLWRRPRTDAELATFLIGRLGCRAGDDGVNHGMAGLEEHYPRVLQVVRGVIEYELAGLLARQGRPGLRLVY